MLVGHQHADEDEQHEEPLDGQNAGPEGPVLLHPAGGAVLAAPASRPTGVTDGHVRITLTAAVPAGPGAAICIKRTHICISSTYAQTFDPPPRRLDLCDLQKPRQEACSASEMMALHIFSP